MDGMVVVVLIVVLGLVFDYTNGFHDAANVVSTVIATKALVPMVAIILAALLNFLGATQIGGVAHTITSGLVQSQSATQLMILSSVVGAIVWNLLTWYYGLPSSSSYALIGGLTGAALVQGGPSIVIWQGVVEKVILPMIFSPIIGFTLAFFFMKLLQCFSHTKRRETLFRHLQVISASFVALAHGLNDAQKSMGIITLGLFSAGLLEVPHIPFWVIISCAIVMGLGTAFGGMRIIKTIGYRITKLEPTQGFAAEVSASSVILAASFMGMPISSTHMIVGSVTGVGSAKDFSAVRWKIFKKMGLAWVLTLPGAALVAAGVHKLFSVLV